MIRLNPDKLRLNRWFYPFVLLIAVFCLISPVLAEGGTVSISYRGAGGYTIGDVITFDGRNTVSNTTLLKITGPGLPDAGVPVSNLNGVPGSGNTVFVDSDGTWKFVWYSADAAGIEKIMTARYTFIATDLINPEKKASTSVILKKPEFSINPVKTVHPGDYVELSGSAEQGLNYVKIDIADINGTILNTFISPVSGTGSFDAEFRVDFHPGQYMIRVSNPSLENSLTSVFSVVLPETPATALTTAPVSPNPAETGPVLTGTSPGETLPVESSAPVTPSTPLSPGTTIAGLIICGLIALAWPAGNRNNKI